MDSIVVYCDQQAERFFIAAVGQAISTGWQTYSKNVWKRHDSRLFNLVVDVGKDREMDVVAMAMLRECLALLMDSLRPLPELTRSNVQLAWDDYFRSDANRDQLLSEGHHYFESTLPRTSRQYRDFVSGVASGDDLLAANIFDVSHVVVAVIKREYDGDRIQRQVNSF